MRLKQRTWFRRTIAAVLVAGMTVATGMFTLVAPGNGGKRPAPVIGKKLSP